MAIILNTTFAVDPSVSDRFVRWAKDVYLPALATEGFSGGSLGRVLVEDSGMTDSCRSFAVQCRVPDVRTADGWMLGEGKALISAMEGAYPSGVIVHFTTKIGILAENT